MNLKSVQWLMAGLLTALISVNSWAQGQGTVVCQVGTFSYQDSYLPTATSDTVKQVTVNVTCTRNTTGTDGTVSYKVAFGDGAVPSGTQNKARNGANSLSYEFYKTSACLPGDKLEGATTLDVNNQVAASGTAPITPLNFWACIPKLQIATTSSLVYGDTVALTITGSSSSSSVKYSDIGSLTSSVSITAPPVCSITANPGNISLNYTAFQGSVVKGYTLFKVTCSNNLAYTTKITDINNTALVTDAVAAGLNYSLGVSTTSGGTPVTSNPMTFTGTGNALDGYIIVTIPANQAGSCLGGCSQTNTHYLTLEY